MSARLIFFRRPLVPFAVLGLLVVMTACLASGQSADGVLEEARGEASYYGDKFAGQTTANGEVFDPSDMTAAHRSLPFGTKVRVTRVGGTQQSVIVRINDRGPYAGDRIIDLSEGAARKIGMIPEGVVDVKIEVLETPSEGQVASSSESGTTGDASSSSNGW